MGRWKPPHPAATIRQTRTCPTRQQRYPNRNLALASIPAGLHIRRDATQCQTCHGWHLIYPPPVKPAQEAA